MEYIKPSESENASLLIPAYSTTGQNVKCEPHLFSISEYTPCPISTELTP